MQEALAEARAADAPARIRLAAYNLAVEALATNATEQAAERLEEIRFATRLMGEEPAAHEHLLAGELARRAGNSEQAARMAESVLAMTRGRHERALHAQAWMLLTAVYTDSGNGSAARQALQEADRATGRIEAPSPLLAAALSGLQAGIAELEGDLAAAAAAYAAQSERLRDAYNLAGMTAAQQRAADLYATLGMSNSAATYYLRAASGLLARGLDQEAAGLLALAQLQAQNSGDTLLTARLADLSGQLSEK